MGNCVRRESSMQWAGDDWGSPEPYYIAGKSHHATSCNSIPPKNPIKTKNLDLLNKKSGNDNTNFEDSICCSSSSKMTEVKVKITKKQLEELLGSVDVKELTVHQVLAKLIDGGDRCELNQRPWKPALQSIPEVN